MSKAQELADSLQKSVSDMEQVKPTNMTINEALIDARIAVVHLIDQLKQHPDSVE